jgi:hypothetical protein
VYCAYVFCLRFERQRGSEGDFKYYKQRCFARVGNSWSSICVCSSVKLFACWVCSAFSRLSIDVKHSHCIKQLRAHRTGRQRIELCHSSVRTLFYCNLVRSQRQCTLCIYAIACLLAAYCAAVMLRCTGIVALDCVQQLMLQGIHSSLKSICCHDASCRWLCS